MEGIMQELRNYTDKIGYLQKIQRLIWLFFWAILFLPSPAPLHFWRRILLKIFKGKIGKGVHVYPSAKIWAPWNLEIGNYSCLGRGVNCYCVGKIVIGNNVVVSQETYLCGATHDIRKIDHPLVVKSIHLEDGVWVAAQAFVGPGVRVGRGAVLGARCVCVKDVEPFSIMVGNPARKVGIREIK